MHAQILNNAIIDVGLLPFKYPNTSFTRPLPDVFTGPDGKEWRVVARPEPEPPAGMRYLSESVELVGGVPTVVYAYQSYSTAEKIAHLNAYRDARALIFTYKSVPMKLGDGARADLLAMYFVVMQNPALPGNMVMAQWQEEGYETIQITAGDLRTDGMEFFDHRQKCFSACDAVKSAIEGLTTFENIEEAFDEAYAT